MIILIMITGAYIPGETMLISDNKLPWKDVVALWENEKVYYVYGSKNNVTAVQNYAQVRNFGFGQDMRYYSYKCITQAKRKTTAFHNSFFI